MKPIIKTIFTVSAIMLLAACNASGTRGGNNQVTSANHEERSPSNVGIDTYRAYLVRLEEAISEGEPRELNDEELAEFKATRSELDSMLEGHEAIEEMGEEKRMAVYNLHEKLESIVIGEREKQMLCRREQTTGSHFRTTTCKTVAQWEHEREASKTWLRAGFGSGWQPTTN